MKPHYHTLDGCIFLSPYVLYPLLGGVAEKGLWVFISVNVDSIARCEHFKPTWPYMPSCGLRPPMCEILLGDSFELVDLPAIARTISGRSICATGFGNAFIAFTENHARAATDSFWLLLAINCITGTSTDVYLRVKNPLPCLAEEKPGAERAVRDGRAICFFSVSRFAWADGVALQF